MIKTREGKSRGGWREWGEATSERRSELILFIMKRGGESNGEAEIMRVGQI